MPAMMFAPVPRTRVGKTSAAKPAAAVMCPMVKK